MEKYFCLECGGLLTPNFMEGGWSHFEGKNPCKLRGAFSVYLSKLANGINVPVPEKKPNLGVADVWHQGTRSFYRARLLKKLTPEEANFDPADAYQPVKSVYGFIANGGQRDGI